VEGEYDFNGKIFNLTQGNIHFNGPLTKKTSLYIVASKEISNIASNYQSQNAYLDGRTTKTFDHLRADIIVKGQVTKPVISFRSDPPLSQREILSYILFNRGISDITTDQGDQLSQSFISLNSSDQTSQTTDFLSRLRNNIGIDRLDFASGSDQNNDYSLQVGKYLTENIFVSINKSINAAVNRVAIEANLRQNLKAQAEVGDDSQIRTSLKWKKDY
jgi:translocation and assembly module TamB